MLSFILVVAGVVATVLVLAAMKPDVFSVSRSGMVNAPPSAVFEHVNDLHKWHDWSPWAKLDLNCKRTYEGPNAGKGAVFAWDGNNKVGAGKMTITESRPVDRILIDLQFFKPFKATNVTEFTFKSEGAQTKVIWTMTGKNTLMSKIMSLFMNCEKMVGTQFEQGLSSLKAIVETGPR